MIVYCVTNLLNGKRYVGQHIGNDFQKYWELSHLYRSRKGLRGRPHLFRAMKKYGIENFSGRVLIQVGTKEDLDYYEKILISKWNTRSPNGYNLTDGGGGGQLGYKASPETNEKKRLAALGRKHTDEWKRKMSERMKGNRYGFLQTGKRKGCKMPEEQRQRLIISLQGNQYRLGIPHSEEARQKISAGVRRSYLERTKLKSVK